MTYSNKKGVNTLNKSTSKSSSGSKQWEKDLVTLADLNKRGILTDAEYSTKKKLVLKNMD